MEWFYAEKLFHIWIYWYRSRYDISTMNWIISRVWRKVLHHRAEDKEKVAFQPVSEDFEVKWNSILYNAERNIVELLLNEAEKVIAKIKVELQEEVIWEKSGKIWEKACGVRRTSFSILEEAGSETQEEVEKS